MGRKFRILLKTYEMTILFQELGTTPMILALVATVLLLVLTMSVAMVSVRYKRLHVLVATLRLPKHRLEDFTVLQEHNAAVTIFDVPINLGTVAKVFQLVFVQALLLALSAVDVN